MLVKHSRQLLFSTLIAKVKSGCEINKGKTALMRGLFLRGQ
jgi:hypothetical protein